ncbi:hypothetical protein ACROYT_G015688 [Oculina patagonica]
MKTRHRSRMKNDMLNSLLHILINGPKLGSKEFEEVIDASVTAWLAAKPRRKCPPKFFSTPVVANSGDISENFVTVQDAGVQTEGNSVTPSHLSIAEEVDATSKALELPADDGDDSDYGSDLISMTLGSDAYPMMQLRQEICTASKHWFYVKVTDIFPLEQGNNGFVFNGLISGGGGGGTLLLTLDVSFL